MSNEDVVTVTIENDENNEVKVEEPKKNIVRKLIDKAKPHKNKILAAGAAVVGGGLITTLIARHRGNDLDLDDYDLEDCDDYDDWDDDEDDDDSDSEEADDTEKK